MPTHIHIPTISEMERLVSWSGPGSVTVYLPTDPDGHRSDAERIELSNFTSEAVDELKAAGFGRSELEAIEESLQDLIEDDEFWWYQARTLAIFATPDRLFTYRLPNQLSKAMEISDRFFIKPLLRTFTFPQTAFVLAISMGAVRLIEASPDIPPDRIDVPDLPTDVASAVGRSSIKYRSHYRRVRGSEGQKIRMRQYSRQINQALALVLGGHDIPLVLAGTEPMISIYRSVNSYPHLADHTIAGNPDEKSDVELVRELRPILDKIYGEELAELHELFDTRRAQGRAVTDLADVARAATIGAVDTLFVDVDQSISGTIDSETGVITSHDRDATVYGVTDELVRRVMLSSGRVLAVRDDDVPGDGPVAALLRFGLS